MVNQKQEEDYEFCMKHPDYGKGLSYISNENTLKKKTISVLSDLNKLQFKKLIHEVHA